MDRFDMNRKVRVTVSADFIVSAGALQYTTDKKADAIFADAAFAMAEEQLLAKVRDALRTIEGSNFTLTLEEK